MAGFASLDSNDVLFADMTPVPLRATMKPTSDAVMAVGGGELVSYTIGTTPPSYTGPQYFPVTSNRIRKGGTLVNDGSGAYFNAVNTASGGLSTSSYELGLHHYGKKIAFHGYAYGDMDFKILCENRHLAKRRWSHTPLTTPHQFFVIMEFDEVRAREFRILLGQIGSVQILTEVNEAVWPSAARPIWLATGDSLGQGAGSTTEGGITAGAMCGSLALKTGWDVRNYCVGGTGLQNPGGGSGSSKYGSPARLAAYAAAANLAGMIVMGPANDGNIGTYTVANGRNEMTALATAMKSGRPRVPLLWFGVESGVYPAISNDLNTLNSALKAEAAGHPELIAKYVDCRQGPRGMWVNGTGQLDNWTGDGNADIFVSSDDVHPTHAGFEYEADLFIDEISDVLVAPKLAA